MLEKINEHYSFANPATVYDEEALTALELAGRTAAKTNECVERVNQIPSDVENAVKSHIENGDFANEIDKHTDELMAQISETEVNFATRVNSVVSEQDTKNKIFSETDKTLDSRINNLLNLPSGSTVLDAEVIDARMDADGVVWKNAGANIRHTQSKTNEFLKTMTLPITERVAKTPNVGYYDIETGKFTESANYRCFTVDVNPGDIYYLCSVYGYSASGAIITDSSGSIISVPFGGNANTEEWANTPIIIPDDGTKLLISSYNNGQRPETYHKDLPILFKITGYENNLSGVAPYLENLTANVNPDNAIFENVGTIKTGMLGKDGCTIASDDDTYQLITHPVKPGEIYRIKAQSWWGKVSYAYYNSGDWPVYIGPYTEGATKTIIDAVITIPVGVRFIRVAGMSHSGGAMLQKCTGGSKNAVGQWGHLKWCCIGDSLTEVNIRTDAHYFDYIHNKTGIYVENLGKSGIGYKKRWDEGMAFYHAVSVIPENCDVVTIFGSGNDGSYTIGEATDTGTETLCGCINTTIDRFYELNPTMKLGIVSPSPWVNQTPDNPECFMYKYSAAMKEICEMRGIPFLDMFRLTGFRTTAPGGGVNTETHDLFFSKDPETACTHPNELGHKVMSSHFYNFLNSLIGTY